MGNHREWVESEQRGNMGRCKTCAMPDVAADVAQVVAIMRETGKRKSAPMLLDYMQALHPTYSASSEALRNHVERHVAGGRGLFRSRG